MIPRTPFRYFDQQLCCEDVPLHTIAQEVGTPTYVYSRSGIVESYRAFERAFERVPHQTCYAVKANSNLAVLNALNQEGAGFDVVSGGELRRLLHLSVNPTKIVFSGVGKTRTELELALCCGIQRINVESLQELNLLAELAPQTGRADVSIRLNPDVGAETHPYIATGLSQHKFGIDMDTILSLVGRVKRLPKLRLTGLACHIGSQILSVKPYIRAFLKLRDLAGGLRDQGFPVDQLDLGGGFGIPYQGEEGPDLSELSEYLKENHGDYTVMFEPGRMIVGSAGALICQVLYTKANRGKRFIVVDGAMNDFMRPSLYQAYHEILPLAEKPFSIEADIVGPICESGDFFARGRRFPDARQGDHLAVMNAGAYGFVFASNYNSRPRAAEVMVDADTYRVVRERESFQELIRSETW